MVGNPRKIQNKKFIEEKKKKCTISGVECHFCQKIKCEQNKPKNLKFEKQRALN